MRGLVRAERGESRLVAFFSSLEVILALVVISFTLTFGVGMGGFVTIVDELSRTYPKWPVWLRFCAPAVWLWFMAMWVLAVGTHHRRDAREMTHPLILWFTLETRLPAPPLR